MFLQLWQSLVLPQKSHYASFSLDVDAQNSIKNMRRRLGLGLPLVQQELLECISHVAQSSRYLQCTTLTRLPSGEENGTFLSAHFTQRQFIVAAVTLFGDGEFELEHQVFTLPIEWNWQSITSNDSKELYDWAADCIGRLVLGLGMTMLSCMHITISLDAGCCLDTSEQGAFTAHFQRALDRQHHNIKILKVCPSILTDLFATSYGYAKTALGAVEDAYAPVLSTVCLDTESLTYLEQVKHLTPDTLSSQVIASTRMASVHTAVTDGRIPMPLFTGYALTIANLKSILSHHHATSNNDVDNVDQQLWARTNVTQVANLFGDCLVEFVSSGELLCKQVCEPPFKGIHIEPADLFACESECTIDESKILSLLSREFGVDPSCITKHDCMLTKGVCLLTMERAAVSLVEYIGCLIQLLHDSSQISFNLHDQPTMDGEHLSIVMCGELWDKSEFFRQAVLQWLTTLLGKDTASRIHLTTKASILSQAGVNSSIISCIGGALITYISIT